jgi:hypothetical protein
MRKDYLIIRSIWIFLYFFVFSLIILISTPSFSEMLNESPDQVWEVGDHRWTVEEEHRFEKWVDENITEDFFIRYRTPTDCAKAVYAIRWIYARIEHLPAAATTSDGKLIGHWSTDWKFLPRHSDWYQDKRFRAALLDMLSATWTGTLPHDTYPVRLSPDSVTPGTLLVTKSHVVMVAHVSLGGSQAHPLQTWESMLPVKVRKLILRNFFSARPESTGQSGLVKFRWPVFENGGWKYLAVKEHPFYSEEQYSPHFYEGSGDFVEAVAKRIDPIDHEPTEKMVNVMGTITRLLKERAPIVLTGYQRCHKGECPEGSDLWEIHQTLCRDEMVILLMDHLSQIIELNHLDKELTRKMMEAIPIDISENSSVTFYDIYQNCSWLSPYPKDSIEARWGLEKCEMIHEQTRITQNSIAFLEKTYRKKDPKYADFTIRRQQEILRRLNEEWKNSECYSGASVQTSSQGIMITHGLSSENPCQQVSSPLPTPSFLLAFPVGL